MKSRIFASFAVVVPSLVFALASHAAPVTAKPQPTVVARPPQAIKTLTELTMKNVGTVPGEKRTYEATLKAKDGTPLANKKVVFRITGKNGSQVPNGTILVGDDMTDAQGKAKVDFALPELAQANYALKASFAGDDNTFGSNAESNLLVVKAVTKIELGDLIWGTYKNEPGPPYGSIGIKLVRTSDGSSLSKPLKITVNGNTWTLQGNVYHQIALQPSNASSWNVKVQFDGDDYAIASGAERTYKRP